MNRRARRRIAIAVFLGACTPGAPCTMSVADATAALEGALSSSAARCDDQATLQFRTAVASLSARYAEQGVTWPRLGSGFPKFVNGELTGDIVEPDGSIISIGPAKEVKVVTPDRLELLAAGAVRMHMVAPDDLSGEARKQALTLRGGGPLFGAVPAAARESACAEIWAMLRAGGERDRARANVERLQQLSARRSDDPAVQRQLQRAVDREKDASERLEAAEAAVMRKAGPMQNADAMRQLLYSARGIEARRDEMRSLIESTK